ncbi:MAG: Nucleoid occlusion protein [Firmicutes bacterium ADurb.Bin193]|nr:MAG: Nucleoid occlusion protein [Firmicutes bacterium ADurb.Bin193]
MEVLSIFNKSGDKKNKLIQIPIRDILTNPRQPRKVFNSESIEELCESIKQYGLIQPVTVRRTVNGKYELIAGERRLRACILADYKTISSIVIDASNCDSAALALIENLQRENLNYIDEAEGYSNLIVDFGLTQEELAQKVGKTQATIANKLRILRLSPQIKKILRDNDLTERHARALLRLETEEAQLRALNIICMRGLNVKQTDDFIDSILQPKEAEHKESKQPNKTMRVFKDIRIFVNTIKQAVDIMRQSGIDAVSEKIENEKYIEYIVRIPK